MGILIVVLFAMGWLGAAVLSRPRKRTPTEFPEWPRKCPGCGRWVMRSKGRCCWATTLSYEEWRKRNQGLYR